MLVSLALLQYASIETKKSQIDNAQIAARANARIAMQIAIAQLQHYTGRDQCVTSRADLLDPRASPDHTEARALQHPYYTLAFQTAPVDTDYNHSSYGNGTFLRISKSNPACLVSGNEAFDLLSNPNEAYPTQYTTAKTALKPENSVVLLTCANKKDVRVPLVPISSSNNVQGSYAYWIAIRVQLSATH